MINPAPGSEPDAVVPRIQSVARAAAILHLVGASPSGLRPTEISEATGIRLQTTYHLLQTLNAVGLLRRDPTGGRYVLGYSIGALVDGFQRHLSPPEELYAVVRRVAERTGEAVYGSGWSGEDIVILARQPGTKPVAVTEMPLGMVGHPFARASGKMLLALMGEEERQAFLDRCNYVPLTRNTLSFDELLAELNDVRKRGYAIDDEEHTEGICCVAAPLRVGSEDFCVTLSAPAARFRATRDDLVAALLEET